MPRTTLSRLLIPLPALALLGACATGPAPAGSLARLANDYSASPTMRSSDFVGSSEVALAGGGTAYDVILRLRPQFLTARTAVISTDAYGGRPVVYLDGLRLGGIDELRTISASMIGEVRFLSPVMGSERFGRYHAGGVIAIRSR